MPDYRIVEVQSKKDLKKFVGFPDQLYRDCPQYVPALHSDQVKSLTAVSTLSYCKHRMWMVMDGKKVVGRICGMINPRYNERYGKKRARFGWFDTINDIGVARLLLGTAESWAREQGMTEIHGPLYYNTLGKQGMLVEGYENVPPFNCLYNYPYYNDLVTALGFEKECDWVQYKLNASQGAPEKLNRMADILMRRYNLRFLDIRKINKEQWRKLSENFFKVYNECFKAVHNFIPLTRHEVDAVGSHYLKLLRPELTCIVVDENDEIATFGLCFPSTSEGFKKAKGKLFPFGWYHILKEYRHYKTIDLMMVGSAPAWNSKGLSAIYHSHLAASFREHHIACAITNPQIETNTAAVKVWESYDHQEFMRRRCFIRPIAD